MSDTNQSNPPEGTFAAPSGSVTPRTDAEEKECAATTPYSDCSCCHVDASFARELEGEIAAIRSEIRETWTAATTARGQMEAYGIMQRMVDRLGYSRTENNPSLKSRGETAMLPIIKRKVGRIHWMSRNAVRKAPPNGN